MSDRSSITCPLCAHALRAGRDYSCPGGDDSCMEGTCPNCKTGFTLCIDGCPVRETTIELRQKVYKLDKQLKEKDEELADIKRNGHPGHREDMGR